MPPNFFIFKGSFTTDLLREMYPSTVMLNSVIWPYTSGEVIVQNYNSVLSLSRLHDVGLPLLSLSSQNPPPEFFF